MPDLNEETRLDWACAQKFNKIIWGKWPHSMLKLYELLEEKGTELREPYSAPLEDGIFELRCKLGSNITRALYFFYIGKRIVVTNGFVKKTQKTPPGEIKLAKDRRKDWIERHEQANDKAGKKNRR